MPRRNGPQARASGFDALRDRLPRSIAARLARAGYTPCASARDPQPTPRADNDEHRDDSPDTSPGPLAR